MGDAITPILMPKWGLSMQEGTLTAWHVDEGARIAPGDEIMDVETDKIANVVEAADGGLLRRRVGQAGTVYPVQALLGVMAPESVPEADIEAYIAAYERPVEAEAEDSGPDFLFADLAVGRIRHVSRGDGDGVPVVLIHGFGSDLDNWLFNIDAIAASAPVHALDLPGHGQSTKTIDHPGLDTMVGAVVQLLDHLSIPRAHLVGHSMGGLVAGQLAIQQPATAASLTLVCPAGLGDDINGDYIEGFVTATSRRALKPHLQTLFADPGLVSRSMVDDLLRYKRLDGVQAFLERLASNLFADGRQAVQIADRLGALSCPIRIVQGAQDAVIPPAHAHAVAGADVTVIDNAGHMVQMENPARVNALIGRQLQPAAPG